MICLSTCYLVHNNYGLLLCAESDPVCNTNISTKDGSIKELEYVEFQCNFNFSGQYVPSVLWSEGDSNIKETFSVINSNASHVLQHLSSLAILQVSAQKNGITITCTTQFNETAKKDHYTNATNIPDYFFTWNIRLNVHCKCIFIIYGHWLINIFFWGNI